MTLVANAYFSKQLFSDKNDWPIDPPDFNWYLTMFKFNVANFFSKNVKADTNYYQIAPRNAMPVVLQINYIQYGEARTVYGLYGIQYQILRNGKQEPQIELKGVLFDRYLTEANYQLEIEKLTQEILNNPTWKSHK